MKMPKLSPELHRYFSTIGKKGGKARLTKMTAAQRRKIASSGGKASAKIAKKGGKKHGS
jgi:hypothetical protein